MKYIITTVIALIFAIPTSGISLIVLITYLYFSITNATKNIEKAILYLSNDSYSLGICFDNIHYAQVLAYASERGKITDRVGQLVKFDVVIKNNLYSVDLNRELGGDGAILSVM